MQRTPFSWPTWKMQPSLQAMQTRTMAGDISGAGGQNGAATGQRGGQARGDIARLEREMKGKPFNVLRKADARQQSAEDFLGSESVSTFELIVTDSGDVFVTTTWKVADVLSRRASSLRPGKTRCVDRS